MSACSLFTSGHLEHLYETHSFIHLIITWWLLFCWSSTYDRNQQIYRNFFGTRTFVQCEMFFFYFRYWNSQNFGWTKKETNKNSTWRIAFFTMMIIIINWNKTHSLPFYPWNAKSSNKLLCYIPFFLTHSLFYIYYYMYKCILLFK